MAFPVFCISPALAPPIAPETAPLATLVPAYPMALHGFLTILSQLLKILMPAPMIAAATCCGVSPYHFW